MTSFRLGSRALRRLQAVRQPLSSPAKPRPFRHDLTEQFLCPGLFRSCFSPLRPNIDFDSTVRDERNRPVSPSSSLIRPSTPVPRARPAMSLELGADHPSRSALPIPIVPRPPVVPRVRRGQRGRWPGLLQTLGRRQGAVEGLITGRHAPNASAPKSALSASFHHHLASVRQASRPPPDNNPPRHDGTLAIPDEPAASNAPGTAPIPHCWG